MVPVVPVIPLLADGEGITAVITILIVVVGWIANLVSNKNQKGPPVANRPRPPVRPRDDRLQQEINIFIEEAGPQRARPAPRTVIPATRPVPGGQRAAAQSKARPPAPSKPARRPRPGDEIASRHAPISESLGAGVKQHLSQQMTERVAQEAQQRLQSRVEQKVEQDLGPAV